MASLEILFLDLKNIKVIDSTIPYSQYTPLDLSAANLELNQLNISDATEFEKYIEHFLAKNKALVAYGGYNEIRNLYKRSTVFNDSNTEERNIHIGLDLWIKAGTPVLAALDGKVHSFQFNNNLGDYGTSIRGTNFLYFIRAFVIGKYSLSQSWRFFCSRATISNIRRCNRKW